MSIAASDAFIDTLRFGAQLVVAELTVFEYNIAGSILNQFFLPCSSAQITNDRNAATRRSGSVTVELIPSIPPPPLMPTAPPTPGKPQPLAPFGNEVAISLGLAINPNAGPLAVTTASSGEGFTVIPVADLTGEGLQFGVGDTVVFQGALPVVVGGVNQTGVNTYLVTVLGGLSAEVPGNAPVNFVEFVPMGMFTITSTTVDATAPELTVTLDVSDRAFVIDARQLTTPYSFPATESGTYEDEVIALLNLAWGTYPSLPDLIFNFSDANNPIIPKATYNQGSSPWQMALDLAQVSGNELYFDQNGIVTSHRYPDVYASPVVWWFTDDSSNIFADPTHTIADGSPYQVPVGVQVTFTRDGIFNDVYITGSGSQNAPGVSTSSSTATGGGGSTSTSSASPVLGHAADTNPASATYVEGTLGDLPEFTQSSLVPTASQAQAMASLDLAMSISSSWQIEVTAQPNPVFDVDDIVVVNYPSIGLSGPNGTGVCMIIDTVATGVKYADSTVVTGRVIPGRYA